jgi:hypothetical protein
MSAALVILPMVWAAGEQLGGAVCALVERGYSGAA